MSPFLAVIKFYCYLLCLAFLDEETNDHSNGITHLIWVPIQKACSVHPGPGKSWSSSTAKVNESTAFENTFTNGNIP